MSLSFSFLQYIVQKRLMGIPDLTKEYCFWDAKSIPDTCPLVLYALIAASVLILVVYRLIKFKKLSQETQDKHYQVCNKVYTLILIWSITFLAQNLFSVISFFVYLNTDPVPKDISEYSEAYAILDKIPAFVIRTIFVTVCILNYQGLNNQIEAQNFQINHKFYRKYIHYIYKARIIFQALGILSVLIFDGKEQIWITSTTNVIYVVVDQLTISFILIYSLIVFIKKGIQPNLMPLQVKLEIKREYKVMIVVDILGVLVNLTFLLYFPFFSRQVVDYKCINDVTNHFEFFFGHNIFGLIVQHLVPIFWFLKMYDYGKTKINASQHNFSKQQTNSSQKLLNKPNS